MHRLIWICALIAAPLAARAEVRLDGGQAEHGVVVEARLGTQLFSVGGIGAGGMSSFATLQGGIFGGYKIGRVIFGLGFELSRVATGGNNNSTAATAFSLSPGLSIAILRSADRRVELFGQFDMGFGSIVNSPSVPNTSRFHFTYDVGPGIRYWVHPQFAFGALAGLEGQFEFDSTTPPNLPATNTSTGLTAIVVQLQLLGVF